MALLDSIKPLGPVPMRIKFDYFLDRAVVKSMLDEKTRRSLIRCGLVIMQNARRSIQKMGAAKPELKAMKANPRMSLKDLANSTSLNKKTRAAVQQRIQEIKFREASKPGTPPNTHTGAMRNSIVFAYDPGSQSVVVGGFMRGIENILALHEFGGMQTMQAWAWVPGEGRTYSGLVGWWAIGRRPRLNSSKWQPMGSQWRDTFNYPARPYMKPAMFKAIKEKALVRQFAGRMRASG